MAVGPVPSPLAPPKSLPMSDSDMIRLAHEIARDLYPLEDVLRQFNVDPYFFRDHVAQNQRFRTVYAEAHAVWHSASNANERSALKSTVMYEEWLAEGNRLFHDQNQPLSAKVELLKLVARVGGLDTAGKGQQGNGVAPGERVVVNINLSAANRPNITIDQVAPPLDVLPVQVP